MKSLRRTTKADKIINMFQEVGTTFTVEEVLAETGIEKYNSLKALFSYIRRAANAAEGSQMDIRIDRGICRRIE